MVLISEFCINEVCARYLPMILNNDFWKNMLIIELSQYSKNDLYQGHRDEDFDIIDYLIIRSWTLKRWDHDINRFIKNHIKKFRRINYTSCYKSILNYQTSIYIKYGSKSPRKTVIIPELHTTNRKWMYKLKYQSIHSSLYNRYKLLNKTLKDI
jgi:hypothetical protein